jgi:hypothetical protein
LYGFLHDGKTQSRPVGGGARSFATVERLCQIEKLLRGDPDAVVAYFDRYPFVT